MKKINEYLNKIDSDAMVSIRLTNEIKKVLRQLAEDVREECAKVCSNILRDESGKFPSELQYNLGVRKCMEAIRNLKLFEGE